MKALRRQNRWSASLLRRAIVAIAVLAIVSLAAGLVAFAYVARDLPSPDAVGERIIAESTKIYDSSGEHPLYNIHGEVKRTVIPFADIPSAVKQATIAAEDDDFYNHIGIDFRSIARAFWVNIRRGNPVEGQGASTITQQFIKNSLLTPEQTLSRKIREWILAIELERRYTKDDILGFYLNQIPYGSNAYGIEAAAQTYFNKHAQDLALGEAVLLAMLPKAPSYYSPYGSHTEDLIARQRWALNRMADMGFITHEQAADAAAQPLTFAPQQTTIRAPHFVMFVREYLERTYGRDLVERGGLSVVTTLDDTLQTITEEEVANGAEQNAQRFGGDNAAAVVIDPTSGKIRAMVGSRDFFDKTVDGNVNVTTSLQQPGSAFKPFAYARAFEKGYSPSTILFDLETNFGIQGSQEYIPQNYTGTFRGPVSMREALAQSINVPSVKTLYLAGVQETLDLAERLGITTLNDRHRYGLSLVLGGGDVTPLEITNAYAAFANDGVLHPYQFIERVTDRNGNELESYRDQSRRVLDPAISRLVTDVLSDNAARAPIFGTRSSLVLPNRPAAAKTGTTQDFRDAWTIGFTPQLVVGVWAGNNDNSPMKTSGAMAAAPIWNGIMRRALGGKPVDPFPPPPPLIRPSTPMLNGSPVWEHSATGQTVREVHTILYYVDKDRLASSDTLSGRDDPQFDAWEHAVRLWSQEPSVKERYGLVGPDDWQNTPSTLTLSIRDPLRGDVIRRRDIVVLADVSSSAEIRNVEFFWDGALMATDRTRPFEGSLTLPTPLDGNDHVISVRASDVNNRAIASSLPVITAVPKTSPPSYLLGVTITQQTPSPIVTLHLQNNDAVPLIQAREITLIATNLLSGDRRVIARNSPDRPLASWVFVWDDAAPGTYELSGSLQTLSGATLQTTVPASLEI